MSRRARITYLSLGGVLLILALAILSVFVAVRSGWLLEQLRGRFIAEAQRATGGKVEVGAFRPDWKTLTVELDGLVIHGKEPVGAAPLLAVRRTIVRFRIVSLLRKEFDVAGVEAQQPQAHLIIHSDGTTNIPEPLAAGTTTSGPETILAVKIGHFDIENGLIATEHEGSAMQKTRWEGRGENLEAHVTYDAAGPRYQAKVFAAPLHLTAPGIRELDAKVSADLSMEKNRLLVSSATLVSGDSKIVIQDLLVNSFTQPVTTARYQAKATLADANRIFRLSGVRPVGTIEMAGTLRYISQADYLISGNARGSGLAWNQVRGIAATGSVTAAPGNIRVRNLNVNALGGRVTGDAEVNQLQTFRVAGRLDHFDANAVASLAGRQALPYNGILAGTFEASRLNAKASLDISPAPNGMPVQGSVVASYEPRSERLELSPSWFELPHSRIDISGVPGDRLTVKAESRSLEDLAPLLKNTALPVKLNNGSLSFDGTVTGPVAAPHITGHGSVRSAMWEGQRIDSLDADFTANENNLTVHNAMLASGGLRGQVDGSVGLTDWKLKPASSVNAKAQLNNADIASLLALAGRRDIRLSGALTTSPQITGTLGDPHLTADFRLSRGKIEGEPYDAITGRAQYLNGGPQLLTAVARAGRKRLNVTARLDHSDNLSFEVSSNAMALSDIVLAHSREPDLTGIAQIKANGILHISGKAASLQSLDGDLSAAGLALGDRRFGDVRLNARTVNGVLSGRLESNAAKASIEGEGTLGLSGNYPVEAKLSFSEVALSAIAALVPSQAGKNEPNLDGSAVGQIRISGEAAKPDLLTAQLDISKFEVHPRTAPTDTQLLNDLTLKNIGPLRATLSKSMLRIDNARFQGPGSNFNVEGTVGLSRQAPLNLRVQGDINLDLAKAFNPELNPTGALAVNATLRGTWATPDFSGRADLRKGEFHYADLANGLTNANGVILFSGTRATIQSFTADSGGGTVNAGGFAALADGIVTFRIDTKTHDVRVRYPPGISSVADADITLAGTAARSEASGTVTIRRIAINPKSDISSIIAGAAESVTASEASSGLLSNLNLDIQVQTSPDIAFQTSVAESLEADASLRIRGTALHPAVLGRINITQGDLVFFGNKYTINQGSISFFNPARIDPILNIDLKTKARGVDVVLTVSGPANKPNLTVRSDPPLQFGDIVALLATGRSPTDPTLASQDTGQSQTLKDIGASALIGQAISSPVTGNLQRFFGVSRIKIDPQLVGVTGSPQARLTIEQQVTPDLLFTYISDVSSTSTQLIQVEWDFNKRWSAILTREQNGYVGIDFAFRKRFK